MKVAIVHHWFVTQGGGERVAAVLAGMFPDADLFTLVMSPDYLPQEWAARPITTSMLQRIPGARRAHRHMLPFYPYAVEQLDLTAYDLVITSDSGPMKGVITRQDAIHICYCHTPMRYLWDGYHSYVSGMSHVSRLPFSLAAHYVRNWDYIAAQRVTHFVANSEYVAKRIQHYYNRVSTVINPPVDTARGTISDSPSDFYLAAGRLVGYKKTEVLIEACNRLQRRLRIVGCGPEMHHLRSLAGPTIEFMGHLSTEHLWETYARCRALLFAADEDFGMVPVEAQACGRPVIAYGKGGSLETIRGRKQRQSAESATGIFFDKQTPEALIQGILSFEAQEESFSPLAIQRHASQFNTLLFVERMTNLFSQLVPEYADMFQDEMHRYAEANVPLLDPAA